MTPNRVRLSLCSMPHSGGKLGVTPFFRHTEFFAFACVTAHTIQGYLNIALFKRILVLKR